MCLVRSRIQILNIIALKEKAEKSHSFQKKRRTPTLHPPAAIVCSSVWREVNCPKAMAWKPPYRAVPEAGVC
jgi:hypothetical protein